MPKSTITLAQIRAFNALAQYKSFKVASEHLRVSQPALINQIAELEKNYDAKLFLRQRGNNLLTDIGLALLPHFKAAIKNIKEAEFLLLSHSQLHTGVIHIAAVSPYRVSLLMKRFHAAHPNIQVKITFGDSKKAQALLAAGEVDAAFYVQRDKQPGQQAFFFYEYELVAILPKDHPLAEKEFLIMSDFETQSYINREEGSLTRQLFARALENTGISLNTSYEIGSREAVREAVAQGLGISVVAEDEHVPHENIVTKRIKGENLKAISNLVVQNDRIGSPLIKALIDVVERAR